MNLKIEVVGLVGRAITPNFKVECVGDQSAVTFASASASEQDMKDAKTVEECLLSLTCAGSYNER